MHDVHDLHVWSINENLRILSAHVVTHNISIREGVLIQQRVNRITGSRIQHPTRDIAIRVRGLP